VTAQLSLLPGTGLKLSREMIPLEKFDGFAAAKPSGKLCELIRDLGLLQPIVVVPAGKGRYRIVEGRRRAKAIALLAEAGEWPAPPSADALVIGSADARRYEVHGGLTLALHASRSASPASELQAIEAILEQRTEDEQATVKEIAAQTGIRVQTVRRRLRLRSLRPGLRRVFDEGTISAAVAEATARLPGEQQQALERQLAGGERITLASVRAMACERASTASHSLPDELFADHATAWQTTVRGHLAAAIAAVPLADEREPLLRALTAARDQAERVA
jgi:ParB-like chromosome segregation protein Spo0J